MSEESKPDFKVFTLVTERMAVLLTKMRNEREADMKRKEEIKYLKCNNIICH